jgi:hypothetical protein
MADALLGMVNIDVLLLPNFAFGAVAALQVGTITCQGWTMITNSLYSQRIIAISHTATTASLSVHHILLCCVRSIRLSRQRSDNVDFVFGFCTCVYLLEPPALNTNKNLMKIRKPRCFV